MTVWIILKKVNSFKLSVRKKSQLSQIFRVFFIVLVFFWCVCVLESTFEVLSYSLPYFLIRYLFNRLVCQSINQTVDKTEDVTGDVSEDQLSSSIRV